MEDNPALLLEETVRDLLDRHPHLPMLEAVLLAAVMLDFSRDSRQLAKMLEVEHALTLRALNTLVGDGWLAITNRHARSARIQVAVAADPMDRVRAA